MLLNLKTNWKGYECLLCCNTPVGAQNSIRQVSSPNPPQGVLVQRLIWPSHVTKTIKKTTSKYLRNQIFLDKRPQEWTQMEVHLPCHPACGLSPSGSSGLAQLIAVKLHDVGSVFTLICLKSTYQPTSIVDDQVFQFYDVPQCSRSQTL